MTDDPNAQDVQIAAAMATDVAPADPPEDEDDLEADAATDDDQ